jgi:hypothetical protein
MSKSFLIVGPMSLVAGVMWLYGARFLHRDTWPDHGQPERL